MAAWRYIKGSWWIFAIPLVVFTGVGIALIFFDTIAAPAMRPTPPWYESMLFLGIIFILSPWIGTAWVMRKVRKGQRREEHLLDHGVRCRATLVSVAETGLYTNDVPEVEMVLDIRSGTGPDRRQAYREHVSLIDLPKLTPGREFTILVDPDDPESVLVLLEDPPAG